MDTMNKISIMSLVITSSLVLITLFFSYQQKLKLEKEIIIGVIRAIVQLVAVGYILEFVFGCKNPIFTTLLVIFMIFNATYNASKRGKTVKSELAISFFSISVGATVTLLVLILSNIIKYEAYQIIPISGMIVGNSMVALGLCYKQISYNFKERREEVETKLSLGADILPASIEIIRDSIKT